MFLITTTGTLNDVIFNDLGARTLSHPVVDYDLSLEYDIQTLVNSDDVQNAIDSGYITVTNGTNTITDLSRYFMSSYVYDVDNDNSTDNSNSLGGFSYSHYLNASNLVGTLPPSVIGSSPIVSSINGMTGSVTLETNNIAENGNLYYTDLRARNSIIGMTGINYNPSSGQIGVDIDNSDTQSNTKLWSSGKINSIIKNDRAMVYTSSQANMTSTTYVDVPGLTYTTKNLGGNGTYVITASISRTHTQSSRDTYFAISVGGNIICESRVATYGGEVHNMTIVGVVSNVASGTIIKIVSKTTNSTHILYNRTLSIDGILDNRLIQ